MLKAQDTQTRCGQVEVEGPPSECSCVYGNLVGENWPIRKLREPVLSTSAFNYPKTCRVIKNLARGEVEEGNKLISHRNRFTPTVTRTLAPGAARVDMQGLTRTGG